MYVSIPYEPFTQVVDSYAPFPNKVNAQIPPEGTVQRGGQLPYEYADLPLDSGKALSKGMVNPVAYSDEVYSDGKVLYERFCAPCHGAKGKGDGKVAEHEAINPSPYDGAGIKEMTGGQIYHTIMMGKGVMGPYSSQLSYEDRWKVVHYVQTLQDPANKTAKEMAAGMTSATEDAGDAEEGGEEAMEEGNDEGADEGAMDEDAGNEEEHAADDHNADDHGDGH